jgi:segregation and condensation protein B
MSDELERILESLLFLSADPVGVAALADAVEAEPDEVTEALERLEAGYTADGRGLVLRRLAGGYALSSHPDAELAARRLLARPRTPPLTAAQAETLAIIAYLQPVSRPEIARIRGVSAESAATTLLERGLVEEAGRSQFGAVLYRTTELFLKLFGLGELTELPEIAGFDPGPDFEQQLRERLLQAGEARSGGAGDGPGPQRLPGDEELAVDAPVAAGQDTPAVTSEEPAPALEAAAGGLEEDPV